MCDLKGQLLTSSDSDFFFFFGGGVTVFTDISGLCIKPNRSVLLAVFSLCEEEVCRCTSAVQVCKDGFLAKMQIGQRAEALL